MYYGVDCLHQKDDEVGRVSPQNGANSTVTLFGVTMALGVVENEYLL